MEGMRVIVEHPVLFKMPRLSHQKEEEKLILDGLAGLKTKFPGLISLTTGKILKEDSGCTHAIFVRFVSQEQLIDYYNSEQLMEVIKIMLPALTGEYTVDYPAFIKPEKEHVDAPVVHITFFRVKDDISQNAVDELIRSLHGLAEEMPSTIQQITAGANNYIRSKAFSHAFVAHVSSVEDFYAQPSVSEVLDKLQMICTRIISVDFNPHQQDEESSRL